MINESERIEDVTSLMAEVVKKEKMLSMVGSYKEACFVGESLVSFMISLLSGHIKAYRREIDIDGEEDEKLDEMENDLKGVKREYNNLAFEPEEIRSSIEGNSTYVYLGNTYKIFADSYQNSIEYQEERNYHLHYHKIMNVYTNVRDLFHRAFPVEIDAPISFAGVDPVDAMEDEEMVYR